MQGFLGTENSSQSKRWLSKRLLNTKPVDNRSDSNKSENYFEENLFEVYLELELYDDKIKSRKTSKQVKLYHH